MALQEYKKMPASGEKIKTKLTLQLHTALHLKNAQTSRNLMIHQVQKHTHACSVFDTITDSYNTDSAQMIFLLNLKTIHV